MSNTNSTTPATKPQPVLIAMSITTTLTVIFGGLATLGVTNGNTTLALVGGVGTLCVAGINQGLAFYTRGQTVPLSDTGAYLNDNRQLVAGPAAVVPDGTNVAVVNSKAVQDGPTGLT